jgi:uncharacterized protein YecE (DUF72 family)
LIRFGSAGWSYPDWEGIVYPAPRARGFDALAYLASFVDCIEVNVSFYRIPRKESAASWAERVGGKEGFLFTVKLWQGFTHEAQQTADDARRSERAFRDLLAPLRAAGLLGAVLVQFPYSFHNTRESRERLRSLLDRFEDLPIVVEVRHASWMKEDFLAYLRERGAAFCNIDQPSISRNIPITGHVTSRIAYVRLHGRNAAAWFEEGAGRDRRYDYLYAAEELADWAGRIGDLATGAEDVFIIANNHYRGQGVANILELKAMVAGRAVDAPASLVEAYPHLGEKVRPVAPARRGKKPAQGALPF